MRELLQTIICTALNNTFAGQPTLSKFVPQETAEREPNLSFHFANELWRFLFWLDCDFDVTKKFHNDKRPDIVFHRRGINALNFLIVEVKRKSNPEGFEEDVDKIHQHWFDGHLKYQFGASVVIDENSGDYEVRLLERGGHRQTQPIKKGDFNSPVKLSDLLPNGRKLLGQKADAVVEAEKAKSDTTALVKEMNKWVCDVYKRPWNIDDIVIGTYSRAWLDKRNLLPSTWGIDKGAIERIRETNIRLTVMYSPASVLTLRPNPLHDLEATAIVLIDANIFENPKLTREENIATMLHEIGHVLDESKPRAAAVPAHNPSNYMAAAQEKENAADDFACQAGYANQIASGLKKLAEMMPEKFANELVKTRIERMEKH